MHTQQISLLLALIAVGSLVFPAWGATSLGSKPPTPVVKESAQPAAAPRGPAAKPAARQSTKSVPSAQKSRPAVTPRVKPAKDAAATPSKAKTATRTTAAAAGSSKGKPRAQGKSANDRVVSGSRRPAKSTPASKGGKRKIATSSDPTPNVHPSFTPLPVIDLSSSGTAPEGMPLVRSGSALVVDVFGEEIYAKNPDVLLPIASITKLMTAMVVLDSRAPLHELITISAADRDWVRGSRSRLQDGSATLSRLELLQLALMSSENRAAAALARTTFPGGTNDFVAAMNRKAQSLGMTHSHFADGTGLDGQNTSTARDLVRMLRAAYEYPEIRHATTTESAEVQPYGEYRSLFYLNTNRLVRAGDWQIELSKTGYLNEAGRCLAMRTRIDDRPLYMVFLNAPGKLTPFEDSNRLRRWLESRS